MKKIKFLITVCLATLVLFSCGNKGGDREMNEYLSAFVNENPTVFLFGKADVNTILEKIDYKSIPKYGAVIESVKKNFSSLIKADSPICYAIEGPMTSYGPKTFYGFIDVTNPEELVKELTREGYDFDKAGDLSYTEFGDLYLGIQKDLAIIISSKEKQIAKDALKVAFDKCYGDLSEGTVNTILEKEGDIVAGMNLASLYESAVSIGATQLDKKSIEKIKKLVAGSYMDATLNFENGEAVFVSENYFSDELKNKMYLKNDESASVLKKLGHGSPQIGFAMNLDMDKIQSFIDEYSPELLTQIGGQLGGPVQMALMMGGDKALSGLFTGQFGFVMMSDKDAQGGNVPSFNAYFGLGKKGKPLAEMGKSFLSRGTMEAIISKDGIACYSSPTYAPAEGQTLDLPAGCENFGKKGVTGFANFEKMDASTFEMDESGKFLKTLKYIWVEADENGMKIILKSKTNQANILKESLDFFIREFEGEISEMGV